jgi:hypothetical protein
MASERSDAADERNSAFDVETVLEELKAGFAEPPRRPRPAAGEDHDRFPRTPRREVPQESLAARVRRAREEG